MNFLIFGGIFCVIFLINTFFKLFFGSFNLQKLAGVGSNELVLAVGGDDFDGYMLVASKKEPLAKTGLQQKIPLSFGKQKRLGNDVYAGRRLAQKKLKGGVGHNGLPVRGA